MYYPGVYIYYFKERYLLEDINIKYWGSKGIKKLIIWGEKRKPGGKSTSPDKRRVNSGKKWIPAPPQADKFRRNDKEKILHFVQNDNIGLRRVKSATRTADKYIDSR